MNGIEFKQMLRKHLDKPEFKFEKVLHEMIQAILCKRSQDAQDGIINCSWCGVPCKADCFSATAPIEHSDHTVMANDWLCCNHYMCRECINIKINSNYPTYTCVHCGEDITWFFEELRYNEDWWNFDDDEAGPRPVGNDAETDETEEEEDECEACGKVVKPVYEDEKGGWTIGNCLTCDAMCCRECLSKYATPEDICCVLCTPHK